MALPTIPIINRSIKRAANAKKHLLNVKLDKKSPFDDFDVEVFVVFALEVDELLALEPVEETLELELIVLESVDFAGLDTGSTSEVSIPNLLNCSIIFFLFKYPFCCFFRANAWYHWRYRVWQNLPCESHSPLL